MAKRNHSRAERRKLPIVRGVHDVVEIVKHLVCDEHTEGQLLLGVDGSRRLKGAAFNCPCDACCDPAANTAEALVGVAGEMGAEELLLVTFVDDDRLAPTAADVARYEGLRVECLAAGVTLLDHLLFSGHRWRSVAAVSLSAGPGASTTW